MDCCLLVCYRLALLHVTATSSGALPYAANSFALLPLGCRIRTIVASGRREQPDPAGLQPRMVVSGGIVDGDDGMQWRRARQRVDTVCVGDGLQKGEVASRGRERWWR